MLIQLLLLYSLITSQTRANNIDILNPITFSFNQIDSLFGFSVRLYTPTSTNTPPSILIGAPRANTGVFRTGNVYSCPPANVSQCKPLPLSKLLGPNEMITESTEQGSYETENKDNMWMGVTIETNDNGPVITCGHRYVVTGLGDAAFMHGICHYLPDITTSSTLLVPCGRCGGIQYLNCLAGLGLTLNSNGLSPLIGAPGASDSRGQVFFGHDFDRCADNQFPVHLEPKFNTFNDSLLGFSIARGRVVNRNFEDVITGIPRYNFLHGGIGIFRNESDSFGEQFIISGEFLGSYFGHVVVTCDLDGDGLDEIIVGLPTYSTSLAKEVGLVQIFFSNPQTNFTNLTLEHPEGLEFSRFGYSIANLGDITKSGGMEFAVGAPFGSGSGKVYIFTWDSVSSYPILFQTISGSEISDEDIWSFGLSISPGRDVDGNKYNDLLIGAPYSTKTFLLYSYPVIRLNSQFQFNTEHIFTRNFATCSVMINGVLSNPICFQMNFLLNYSGIDVPSSVNINLDITLDRILYERAVHFRIYFVKNGIKTNKLEIKNLTINQTALQSIMTEQIYVESNPVDLFTAVEFYVAVTEFRDITRDPNYFTDVKILAENTFSESLQIRNIYCGDDNLCKSDLEISGILTYPSDSTGNATRKEFIVNEVKQLTLSFEIENKLEEALSPILHLFIPPALSLTRIKEAEYNIHNETTYSNHSSLILIDIGASLVENETAIVNIILASSQFAADVDNFTIEFSIRSINFEDPNLLDDNFGSFFVSVKRRAILQLQGFLETDQVYYNGTNPVATLNSIESLGSEVIHSYLLNNLNSSTVRHLRVNFIWPLGKISTNEYLLYLTSLDIDANSALVQCDLNYINYLNLSTSQISRRSVRSAKKHRLFKREETNTLPTTIRCNTHPELCVRFNCFISNLQPSEGITFTIKSRVFDRTLSKLSPSPTTDWELYTTVSVDVIESGVDMISFIPPEKEINLLTKILPQEFTFTYFKLEWYHIIPIILAIIVPCVLFIILFIILYFCGFFKIKKRGRQELHIPTEEDFEEESNDFNIVEVGEPMPF